MAVPTQPRLTPHFWRWAASYTASSMPSAMAPIGFSLATVAASNSVHLGAAMMAAMTLGQVVCAVPLSKVTFARLTFATYLRLMLVGRALFFIALTAALVLGAAPPVLIVLAGASGIFNGAIYGYYRTLLNSVVAPAQLARALAITATTTEIIFVTGPVVAAVLGTVWATLPLVAMALCALVPAVVSVSPLEKPAVENNHARRRSLSPALAIWSLCELALAMAVGGIEVGAVTLVVHFGLTPSYAAALTLALCIASVTGGAVITVSNRALRNGEVYALIGVSALAALTISWSSAGRADTSAIWLVLFAAAAVGLCLAPLETFFSIAAEKVLPLSRRAEGFSVLRTAQGLGFLTASTLLALSSPAVTFLVGAILLAASLAVAVSTSRYVLAQSVDLVPVSQ